MPHPEINNERGTAQEAGEQQDLVGALADGIAQLNVPASKDLYINASESTEEPRFFRVETEFKPMFVNQTWHRLYAGALLETDRVKLSLFVVLAEEAILDRYVELIPDVPQSDEIEDLQKAIAVLSQLRESNLIDHVAPQFVA
jgi:hypothetical protein